MSMKETFEIRWCVKNADLLWKENISLISPTVNEGRKSHPHRRRLIMRMVDPETKEETIPRCERATGEGYISLYVQNLFFEDCDDWGPILYVTFSLIHPIKGVIISQSEIQFNGCSSDLFGFERFVSMEKLKENSLDKFTIVCKSQKLKQDFTSFATFLGQETCSDVNLTVGVDDIQVFAAHKLVLALGSYDFQYKLAQEKSVSCLKMENTKPAVVEKMLRYIYTGEVVHTKTVVYELFEAALKHSVRGLRLSCQAFLLRNLKLENVVHTLLSCKEHFRYDVDYLNKLIMKCMSLIDENLDEVLRLGLCKELLGKGPEILTEIVAHLSTSNVARNACTGEESSASSQIFKERFERFAKSSDFSDIVIQVNDSKYPAHKLILASSSPVFDRMFSNSMKEKISGVVVIEDIRPPIFEKLLGYMYTSEIESEDYLIQEIMIASDKYEINDLKLICEKLLGEKLTSENVVTALIFAADYNADRLKKKCLRFITHADSPFWSDRSNYFKIPKSILNESLAKSHPHLLHDMMKEIGQNKLS